MKSSKQQQVTPWTSTKGFLKVPNEILEQIYSDKMIVKFCGRLYLCILHHAYFAETYIIVNEKSVLCRRGEWITTYSIIEKMTQIARCYIGNLLNILVNENKIEVYKQGYFTCIKVCGYNDLTQSPKDAAPPPSGLPGGKKEEIPLYRPITGQETTISQ